MKGCHKTGCTRLCYLVNFLNTLQFQPILTFSLNCNRDFKFSAYNNLPPYFNILFDAIMEYFSSIESILSRGLWRTSGHVLQVGYVLPITYKVLILSLVYGIGPTFAFIWHSVIKVIQIRFHSLTQTKQVMFFWRGNGEKGRWRFSVKQPNLSKVAYQYLYHEFYCVGLQ